jgi:hypothetical protein
VDDVPEYLALSYTWGDLSNRRDIYINGHKFSITSNLYQALQHLRSNTAVRHLWIDAICINQNDNEQVPRMREVYSRAQCVIVWLGRDIEPEDEERNFATFQKRDAGGFEDGARSSKMVFDFVRKLSGAWQSAAVMLSPPVRRVRPGNPLILLI